MLDRMNRQPEAFFLEYDGSFCPWYAEGMENQTTYAKFLATLNNFTSKFSSQQKAADELGVPQPTISKIKSGKGVQSDTLFRMLDAMGVRLLAPGEKAETKDLKSEIDRINADVFRVLASRGVSSEIITEVQRAIMNIEAAEQPSHRQAAGE